jgi:hypothetical protein
MSSSINALNGNGVSLQFEEFARLAGKSSNVVRFLGSADAASVHEVSVTKSDKVGKWLHHGGGGRVLPHGKPPAARPPSRGLLDGVA